MRVLVACEESGVVRRAFREKGHDAYSCDILPARDGSSFHYELPVEVLLREEPEWDLMIAHPPCTALCCTGNRHYAGTEARERAVEFFRMFLTSSIDKVCVENPVGVISTEIRPPDQYIHPWQFGYPTTKKTGLWLKGLPLLKETDIVPVDPPVVHKSGRRMSRWYYETGLLPKEERSRARSETFPGIAKAMAEQWG